ncbi:MAG: hypothetical protein K2X87_11105 [Gemmataceae bacterium]|nr:hypothetical protein [Gemmataceae bacterium]
MTPTATPLPAPTVAPPAAAPVAPTPPAVTPTPPPARFAFRTPVTLRPFTVAEYDKMIEVGILGKYDPVELLEGYVVLKMSRNPPHDGSVMATFRRLERLGSVS